MSELNKYSKNVTQDSTQPAAQAMLYAIGFKDEDFSKPLIGNNSYPTMYPPSFSAGMLEINKIELY